MNILVTGGAGYIGSVTNWFLKSKGHTTIVFDNLQNGHREAVGDSTLIHGDLRKKEDIDAVFEKHPIDAVIHFAALALAGESMEKPYEYYRNNIMGGLNLLEAMRTHECKTIIFSSTCAVYGFPKVLPVTEDAPIAPVSVYGASKRNFEEILAWYDTVYGIKHTNLRYFNACGALPDGTLGEAHPVESHIIPVAISHALKETPFTLFGTDYQTPDGTCIRDYIHVLDLADAHLKAVEYLKRTDTSASINLGVGKGYSNREILKAVESVSGKPVAIVEKKRRWGDPDAIYADNSKAKSVLGWTPQYTDIRGIIETAWKFHVSHPDGYART